MANKKSTRPVAPEVCPVCGEDVPRRALACPECGADHRSGWREDAATYDGIGLEEEFDYDQFVKEEFGSSPKPPGLTGFWWVVAILVTVAMAIILLHSLGH